MRSGGRIKKTPVARERDTEAVKARRDAFIALQPGLDPTRLVFVDESGYLERIGNQGGGTQRIAERIALWREFCRFHDVTASIVNLLDAPARRADVEAALGTPERSS